MTTHVETAQRADAMVRRGAELLDKAYRCGMPGLADWRSDINTAKLDIDSPKNCILGQLFRDYYVGKAELEISSETAADCGFTPSGDVSPRVLTLAWVRYLNSCPVAEMASPPFDAAAARRTLAAVKALLAAGETDLADQLLDRAMERMDSAGV